ncbi:MAG: hypothetical protein FJ398_10410 [Verrucomicrobia bacterium]|nr:hypothetical protein [Verrucomicrobiota bacterium]
MTRPAIRMLVWFALITLFLIAGIALFLLPPKTSIGHTVTFSDGTTMTLRQVTYGTEHSYYEKQIWRRVVSLLPRKLIEKLGVKRSVMKVSRPSVVFWLERRGNGLASGDPQLVLCDADGFGISSGYSMMRVGPPGNCVEGWASEFWPRREGTFRLQIYEPGPRYPEADLIGEFFVRNPTPGNYPQWAARPLPQTAIEGDLSVTLFDLTAGVGRGANNWRPARNPTVSQTRAGFRVARNGSPTREWEIASVEARDATGNVIASLWSSSPEPEVEFGELQPHPWPAESAWKLRVGFSQRSNFGASEIWNLRGVALSGTNSTEGVLETNLQGAVLQYTGQARRPGLPGDRHFNFRVKPGRPDYEITLVKAVDDQGQEAELANSFVSQSERTFSLRVNASVQSLDFTLALHRTRYFEFLARPEVISTNRINAR